MSPWSQRNDNRRRLIQASNNIDTSINHLMRIHDSYPEGEGYEQHRGYDDHRELLRSFCVALDQLKDGLLGYRETI
ncbi:hypothetical protein LCGC14_2480580 [marine sediment metagenome]|uniref:Uncharacterized protein n=1 Tax=marine sediment metagenome TaxID=412755 RepID=A0A0F9B7Q8_9ZZZZ